MESADPRKIRVVFTTPLVVLMLLLGCAPVRPASQQLQLLLHSGAGCVTPCWNGLTPEVSTVSDLQALVDASPRRSLAGFREIPLYDGDFQYLWEDKQLSAVMEAETTGTTISYIGYLPRLETITLGSVLEELGPPDMYSAMLSTFEKPFLSVWMFYEERGIVVDVTNWNYDTSDFSGGMICEVPLSRELPAREIFLLEPAPALDMNDFLARLSPSNLEPLPWKGADTIRMTRCEPGSD
jgi:hypothetical protein